MWTTFTALVIVALLLLSARLRWQLTYWQRHNVPHVPPLPLLGNLKELLLLRISFGDYFRQLYAHAHLCDAPIGGIYLLHTPALIIRDPQLIKLVLIKHFHMFLNRYEAADPVHDQLGSLSLPLSKYAVWRECRKRMAEFFTSGRLKERIYPLMLRVATDLEDYLERQQRFGGSVIVEVKEMCALFTTDLTAVLSFGIDAKGLRLGESSLRSQVRELFDPTARKALHFFMVFFLPHLTGAVRAKVFSSRYANFMRRLVNDAFEVRRQRNTSPPTTTDGDLLDILLKFRRDSLQNGKHQFTLHPDFVASQAAIFVLAGFETSSSTIAFALYELAKQPLVQARLHAELGECFRRADRPTSLSYEALTSCHYLHMIVLEALRLYPAASFINRECTPAPNESGFSLQPHFDFEIPRGMPAYISILGVHRDPKYWRQPELFDPERFAPAALPSIDPMTYLPFGLGPHSCIGSRLGMLQVKLGIVHLLRRHKVECCDRTASTIRFNPKTFMLQADGGIYLRFIKHNPEIT